MCARQKSKKQIDEQELIGQLPVYEGLLLENRTFEQIFACIYTDVVDYTWYLLDDLWRWGTPDCKGREEIRSQSLFVNDIQITDSDLLLRYANAASNDWCTIYGLLSPPGIESFAHEISQKVYGSHSIAERFDFHFEVIDACLFNVDGAYWAVFSMREHIRRRLCGSFPEASPVRLSDFLFCF